VWTTCPELLLDNAPAGSRTCNLSITSPTLYHYTTEPPKERKIQIDRKQYPVPRCIGDVVIKVALWWIYRVYRGSSYYYNHSQYTDQLGEGEAADGSLKQANADHFECVQTDGVPDSHVCLSTQTHVAQFSLKVPSHHDVLASARIAFNKFHKKMHKKQEAVVQKYTPCYQMQIVQICSDLLMSTWQSVCSSVNQRMGNVLVASTSVLIAFHWRLLQISRRSNNGMLAFC